MLVLKDLNALHYAHSVFLESPSENLTSHGLNLSLLPVQIWSLRLQLPIHCLATFLLSATELVLFPVVRIILRDRDTELSTLL